MTALLKQKGDHKMVLGTREHCILATHPKMHCDFFLRRGKIALCTP